MRFDELKLCMAIRRANLGGRERTSRTERRDAAVVVMREFVYLFDETRFPYSLDDVSRWVVNYRKNKNTRIKVQVALVHGYRCFWDGRGKGPCCDEVECGHIFQNYKGGELSVENCMIECRSHNNQRRAMSIEDYIADRELTTARQLVNASYTG